MFRTFTTRKDVTEAVLDVTQNYLTPLTSEEVQTIVNHLVSNAGGRYENIDEDIWDDCDFSEVLERKYKIFGN